MKMIFDTLVFLLVLGGSVTIVVTEGKSDGVPDWVVFVTLGLFLGSALLLVLGCVVGWIVAGLLWLLQRPGRGLR